MRLAESPWLPERVHEGPWSRGFRARDPLRVFVVARSGSRSGAHRSSAAPAEQKVSDPLVLSVSVEEPGSRRSRPPSLPRRGAAGAMGTLGHARGPRPRRVRVARVFRLVQPVLLQEGDRR